MNQRDPYVDFCGILRQFANETFMQLSPGSVEYESLKLYLSKIESYFNLKDTKETILNVIKPIVKRLHRHSRDILFRNGCIFGNELKLFDDIIDVSSVWRKQDSTGKKIIWEYVEQLYVIGNVVVYPERKNKFLQLVRVLKQQQSTISELENDCQMPDDHVETTEISRDQTSQEAVLESPVESESQPEAQQAINDINSAFGLQEGDIMTDMVGDIALQVNDMMQSTDNPQALLSKMMSGDMSMFQNMMEEIGGKIEKKIESGEIDRSALEAQAKSMVGKFQGLTQQMGISEMMQGQGMMSQMMQGQIPQMPGQGSQMPVQNQSQGVRSDVGQTSLRKKKKKKKKKKN